MSRRGQEFIGVVPPKDSRPRAAFFNGSGGLAIIRDQLTISSWLSIGAVIQGILFLAVGCLALVPAIAVLAYRVLDAYAQAVGWKHNRLMDGIIHKKIAAQIPNELGQYGFKPANTDIVVFLIGTRCNHPLGLLDPSFRKMSDYFVTMSKDLDDHADEFGFLGMTSWLNASDRSSGSEIMSVCYFRNIDGLHAFAHSKYHREGWDWWNKTLKDHPYLSIFHETYHVPKGHWENVAVNSHASGINSLTSKYTDEMTGAEKWASPIVDASRGLLRTSAGRMDRSALADEHDKYMDPYDS